MTIQRDIAVLHKLQLKEEKVAVALDNKLVEGILSWRCAEK